MMSRPVNVGVNHAAHYYDKDDFYDRENEEQTSSYWYGKGAEALGLKGEIDSIDFQGVLEGRSPAGKRLQAKPIDIENHRAATDCVFSASKSVSLAGLVQGDKRLIDAFDRSVQSALDVAEKRYAQTRQYNSETGKRERVCTGNLTIAVFTHETSRNLDPQLHKHTLLINSTEDQHGNRKSLSNELVVENQKLLGQICQNNLAYNARRFGYEIERLPHGQFELQSYPKKTLEAFSTRRTEVLAEVAQSGEPESARNLQRAALHTRSKKQILSQQEKRDRWEATIEENQLQLPSIPETREIEPTRAEDLVHHCLEDFAKEGVTFRREQLERHILETSLGECRFEEIEIAIDNSPELVKYGDRLTTRDQSDRLIQLEELLGLDYAENKNRQTEQVGRTIEANSDRDSGRIIGSSVAERLETTLRASSHVRGDSEQIDRCFVEIDRTDSEPGIDVEAVARGLGTVRERTALEHTERAVAAAFESVNRDLAEFERISQQYDRLVEQYRDRLAAREASQRPLPGSLEWSRAEFVLGYAESTLRHNDQIWIENDRYWAERNPASGEVLVGRKVDNQVIAEGRLSAIDWEVSTANVDFSVWLEFVKGQQQQQQLEHQKAIDLERRSQDQEVDLDR